MTHPLRLYRTEHGISAQAFATAIGTSRQTIHRIETGEQNPSLDMVRRIMAETRNRVTGVDLRPDLFSAEVVRSFAAPKRMKAGAAA